MRRLTFTVLLLSSAVAVGAVGPRVWSQSGHDDFVQGRADGVSITRVGDLRLAPAVETLWESSFPHVWSMAAADDGTVFVGVGNEGQIYRLTPDGEAELFFASQQLEVQAMAWDGSDHLVVATAPRGAIYRVSRDYRGEEMAPVFVPEREGAVETYAWSVAVDASGRIYVGTGGDGVIFRIDGEGEGQVFFDSAQTHITSLAVDPDGDVIAGSSPDGHVYRLSPDGEVFVLYDTPYTEITDVAVVGDSIYVGTLGGGPDGEEGSSTSQEGSSTASPVPSRSTGDADESGAVYRIGPDGRVEELWSSDQEGVHSLAAHGRGVVVGTGPKGRLLRVGSGDESSVLLELDGTQITALAASGSDLVLGSSNVGAVYRMSDRFRPRGEYVSQVEDVEAVSQWGAVRWHAVTPAGTAVELYVRSGNTSRPDNTWSDWSGPYTGAEGSTVDSPAARFVQWRSVLTSESAERTPALGSVELVYVQRNLRPTFDDLTVHPAGVVYRQRPGIEESLPFGQLPAPVQEALAEQGGDQGGAAAAAGRSGRTFLGRPYYLPGHRSFTWEARDPNADELVYRISYRADDESTWKVLEREREDNSFDWDTTRVPDGRYLVRITASDSPSNARGAALEVSRTSQPFMIDNTPPTIQGLELSEEGDGVRVTGRVVDGASLIRRIDYSVDGGDWQVVLPADGLADSTEERIAFAVPGLTPGEHTIVVRGMDVALNSGTARSVVVVR